MEPQKPEHRATVEAFGRKLSDNISDRLLTTTDICDQIQKDPSIAGMVFKSILEAARVGLGVFTKNTKNCNVEGGDEDKEPKNWDPAVDGELTLDQILHVAGDESDDSWGPATESDQSVWTTIV